MRDESNKLFLCYTWEDLAQVKQLILETEHEIDTKISSDVQVSGMTELNDEISDRIADSELIIVFISDAAKKSDFVRQCVIRASHLNKNILPVEIEKQGLFGSKLPEEFKFRSKTYAFDDPKSKAAFFAQLKASLGIMVEGGDAFGALVHIVTDRDACIKRYGEDLGYARPDSDCRIRLAKGQHLLRIEDALDSTLFTQYTIEIEDNSAEQFLTIPLTQLLKEKKEREEQELYQEEIRKKIEREEYEQNLRREAQRREEARKREEELRLRLEQEEAQRRQLEAQRRHEEERRLDEERRKKSVEWAQKVQSYQSSQSENKSGCGSSVVGIIIGIAALCFIISLL